MTKPNIELIKRSVIDTVINSQLPADETNSDETVKLSLHLKEIQVQNLEELFKNIK